MRLRTFRTSNPVVYRRQMLERAKHFGNIGRPLEQLHALDNAIKVAPYPRSHELRQIISEAHQLAWKYNRHNISYGKNGTPTTIRQRLFYSSFLSRWFQGTQDKVVIAAEYEPDFPGVEIFSLNRTPQAIQRMERHIDFNVLGLHGMGYDYYSNAVSMANIVKSLSRGRRYTGHVSAARVLGLPGSFGSPTVNELPESGEHVDNQLANYIRRWHMQSPAPTILLSRSSGNEIAASVAQKVPDKIAGIFMLSPMLTGDSAYIQRKRKNLEGYSAGRFGLIPENLDWTEARHIAQPADLIPNLEVPVVILTGKDDPEALILNEHPVFSAWARSHPEKIQHITFPAGHDPFHIGAPKEVRRGAYNVLGEFMRVIRAQEPLTEMNIGHLLAQGWTSTLPE